VPAQELDVIMFAESMYQVPLGKVKRALEHYAKPVKPAGVPIVRTDGGTIKHRRQTMLRIIEREFAVIESSRHPEDHGSLVIVFRPRHPC